jgi:PBP1b-binding outer membrane lipoprotein LpoB
MKKTLSLIGVVLLLTGCAPSNTPMQAVVKEFNTTEVKMVPYTQTQFIVKDTKGSVWYVDTKQTDQRNESGYWDYECYRKTLLFGSPLLIKKVDQPKLEE